MSILPCLHFELITDCLVYMNRLLYYFFPGHSLIRMFSRLQPMPSKIVGLRGGGKGCGLNGRWGVPEHKIWEGR